MYEAFFGVRERPFDLTPSPRYLVMTELHREALRNLEYGIASRKGFTLLLGEAGSGKTTVIRAAIDARPERVHWIHLSNPTLSRQEFNEMLAANFGLSPQAGLSKTAMLVELEALLTDRLQRGETSVLVVDEAQSMPNEILEEIRLLGNLETDDVKLLSIVLAGQPELADRLNQHELRQLKQRVALRCEIRRLSREETGTYVVGRMRAAGGSAVEVFTPAAIDLLHDASHGLPRTINVIADNALLGGFATGRKVVDREIVQEVCRDFAFDFDAAPVRVSGFFEEEVAPLPATPADALPASDFAGDVSDAGGLDLLLFETTATTSLRPPAPLAPAPADAPEPRKQVSFTVAVSIVAIALTISMGIVARGAIQPQEPAASPVEIPEAPSIAAPVAPALTSPSVISAGEPEAPPPVPVTERELPPVPAAELRRNEQIAPPTTATTAAAAAEAPERAPVVTTPVVERQATAAVSVSAAPTAASAAATRSTATGTTVALPVTEPSTAPPPRLPVPVSVAAPATAVSAGVSAPVLSPPGGNPAGAGRGVRVASAPAPTSTPAPAATAISGPIQSVLNQYRLAFGTLDASGVERFWPGVNARNLQRAFDQMDSQRIEFDSCTTNTMTTDRAQVSCAGRSTFVPKVGNSTPRTDSRRWTFHLSRANTAWIIDRVDSQ